MHNVFLVENIFLTSKEKGKNVSGLLKYFSFFFQNPASPDSVKLLGLLCLGEIGKTK